MHITPTKTLLKRRCLEAVFKRFSKMLMLHFGCSNHLIMVLFNCWHQLPVHRQCVLKSILAWTFTLFCIINHYSRYLAGRTVTTISLPKAIVAIENLWIAQLWYRKVVRGDLAFRFDVWFSSLLILIYLLLFFDNICYYANLIDHRREDIMAIYLHLKDAALNFDLKLLLRTALRTSNEMYGSESLSAH